MSSLSKFWTMLAASALLAACGGNREAVVLTSPEASTSRLTVNKLGAGQVKSTPEGINCGSQCNLSVETGTAVTLEATPANGYKFSGWSGSGVDCSNTSSCTMMMMEESKSLTATFSPVVSPTYAWNLSISGSGTVTTDRGDSCTGDCSGQVSAGTTITFTATPATGYSFAGWSGSGLSCTGTAPCQVPMDAARSLTATFTANPLPTFALSVAVTGSGTVGSSPAGIDCTGSCSANYEQNTVVTLAATPAKGYAFSGWSGSGCSGTGSCKVTMSAARSVAATFTVIPPSTAALNTVVTGSGTVTSSPAGIACPGDCAETLNEGTAVTLTATPASGQRFSGWSGGACSGTGGCSFTLSTTTSVGATFVPITYALSVSKQGTGTVTSTTSGIACGSTCSASYNAGTSVTLKAAPGSGYTFGGWSGACSGTGDCTVTMNAATSVTATFNAIPTYLLTVSTQGTGTVASNTGGISCGSTCSATYASGSSVTLTATAGTGYTFSGWGGACTGTASTCAVTVSAATSVTATFTAISSGGGGSGGGGSGTGNTYYVDASAANDNGTGSASSPKKYISSGMALMSSNGGDTLIIKAGTYSNAKDAVTDGKSGKAGAWNVIKAEVDGTVTITAGLGLGLVDHYLQFEGLKWDSKTEKGVTGRYVKFLRCAFKDGPTSDNTMILGIGTNDATPGAQYILVEDSYVYGAGGRYNLLVYNSDKVVLRRVVARHGDGWTDTKGDPQAAVSLYNSTNVLTQNLLIVDSGASGYFEAALYHPSNSRASSNIQNTGAIILNTAGTAVAWDDANASSGNLLEDSVIWKAASGISINGAAHSGLLNRITMGKVSGSGFNDWSGNKKFSVTNSVVWDVTTPSFKDIVHSSNVCYNPACSGETSVNPATSGMLWITQTGLNSALSKMGANSTRAGATVIKRLGVSGTLYGDTGYNQTTSDNLWPWPQEAAIKKAMCTDIGITTGFCASGSMTQYVWEQLGNAMPSSFGEQ